MPYSWAVWMGFAVWGFHILYLSRLEPGQIPVRSGDSGQEERCQENLKRLLMRRVLALWVKPGPAWHMLLTDKVEDFTNPLEWLIET